MRILVKMADRCPLLHTGIRWLQGRSASQKSALLATLTATIVLALSLLNATLHHRAQTALLHTLRTTTQVTVHLGDLRLNPLRGQATLTDLLLSNPPNFSPQPLLTLDRLSLRLHLPSLWESPLSFPEIRLQGLTLRVEQRLHRNNLAQLLDRLETLKTQSSGPNTRNSPRPKAFQIDHLILSEVSMIVRLNILGEIGAEKTLNIALIDLEDLTQDTLADRLRSALLTQAQQHLQEILQDRSRDAQDGFWG
ncbi:MAG: hypothetical protein VKK80_01070 [Prochlorothrix sp.]|nr:hypothetical protein [Prochlorothrix sp.]